MDVTAERNGSLDTAGRAWLEKRQSAARLDDTDLWVVLEPKTLRRSETTDYHRVSHDPCWLEVSCLVRLLLKVHVGDAKKRHKTKLKKS